MFAGCRLLIRIASWMLPRAQRPDWVRKWETAVRNWAEFLVERDGRGPATYARIARASCRAFPDAFRAGARRHNLRSLTRKPAFFFAVCSMLFVALAALSSGFSGFRSLLRPLPFPDSRQLVFLGQTDVFGVPFGVRSSAVPDWQRETKLAAGLAMFALRRGRAVVGTNFFDVLGARPLAGRTFRPGDEIAEPPPVVLTHELWSRDFGSDRAIVGRTVSMDGRDLAVIGVLPPDFRALSRGVRYFTPLHPSLAPRTVGLLGRLRPGASPEMLRAELVEISRARRWSAANPTTSRAHQRSARDTGSGMRLTPLERPVGWRFAIYAAGLLIGVAVAAVMLLVDRPRGAGWRYLSFLTGKALALLTIVVAVWIELAGAVPGEFIVKLAFNWVFLILCGCAVYWAFFDQRRRCPVCLERLAMPVTIGSWSSPLLEPVSTELLCERGHGALCIHETRSSAAEPDSWTSMDESWRELFTK